MSGDNVRLAFDNVCVDFPTTHGPMRVLTRRLVAWQDRIA